MSNVQVMTPYCTVQVVYCTCTHVNYLYITAHATGTLHHICFISCAFQCRIFPLLYDFVLFVAEYHLFSVPPVVAVVSYMPSPGALLKSRLVKPTDGGSVFVSRKEKVEKPESV